jgi:transposase-like protein
MQAYQTIQTVLAQANDEDARHLFQQMLRASVRQGLMEAMAAEVELLCGPKYSPQAGAECRRAGSERGQAFVNGARERIIRPRVRSEQGKEVPLQTYQIARDRNLIFDQVVEAIAAGMPVRGVQDCFGGAVKRTQASAMWVEKSRQCLEEFRSRDLRADDWLAMWIDGVFVGKEQCLIIALGLHADGRKEVLDFEPGASENAACCKRLLERISERGFAPPAADQRLLVVRDGSKALGKAVRATWPEALQQECLIHAERETQLKLPKKAREEASRLFTRLRLAEGAQAGEEAFEELIKHLKSFNADATACLAERKDALLVFHRLNVPATLNRTFLSTNHIENLIRNWRQETQRTKSWNLKSDQLSRWTAVGLLEAERGFRRIRAYPDLGALAKALQAPQTASDLASVAEEIASAIPSSTPAKSDTSLRP